MSGSLRTGDSDFDNAITILSDNPGYGDSLSKLEELRLKIQLVLEQEVFEIKCDGVTLWIGFGNGARTVSKRQLDLVVEFVSLFERLSFNPNLREQPIQQARFFSYATIALTVFTVLSVLGRDSSITLFAISRLFCLGTALGFLLLLLGLYFVRSVLSKAPWSQKLAWNCSVAFFFLSPLTGIAIINDLNIHLDEKPISLTVPISGVERVPDGEEYNFEAVLEKTEVDGFTLPKRLEIPVELFKRSKGKSKLRLSVGRGAFGIPWMQETSWAK